MKKYLFITMAMLGMIALASCNKEGQKQEPAAEISNVTEIGDVPFTGGTFKYEFDANRQWIISGTSTTTEDFYEPELSPRVGDAGHSIIEITLPANRTQSEIEFAFTITLLNSDQSTTNAYTKTVEIIVPAPSVTDAAGNVYKAVYLKDGNYWMAENLRYVPEGKTVSEDPAKGDIWYPYDFASLKAVTDKETIESNGLFYTLETALGTTLSLENADKQEKVQGICPTGWHIPSFEEAYVLFGGASGLPASCNLDKPYEKAYYYYADYKGGNVKKFNEAEPNANLKFVGSVSIAGAGRAYQKGITDFENYPMTNFWTSTLYQTKKVTDKDELDKTKSQNFSISLMAVKNSPDGKINLGYTIINAGSSIRCVKDKAAE